ncbi:hypothetical protein FB451DRAFT_1360012 [Mycena latifolia]|nr:hypothetical protein FB451DRAFT_1360012 [Mycena latifolia]
MHPLSLHYVCSFDSPFKICGISTQYQPAQAGRHAPDICSGLIPCILSSTGDFIDFLTYSLVFWPIFGWPSIGFSSRILDAFPPGKSDSFRATERSRFRRSIRNGTPDAPSVSPNQSSPLARCSGQASSLVLLANGPTKPENNRWYSTGTREKLCSFAGATKVALDMRFNLWRNVRQAVSYRAGRHWGFTPRQIHWHEGERVPVEFDRIRMFQGRESKEPDANLSYTKQAQTRVPRHHQDHAQERIPFVASESAAAARTCAEGWEHELWSVIAKARASAASSTLVSKIVAELSRIKPVERFTHEPVCDKITRDMQQQQTVEEKFEVEVEVVEAGWSTESDLERSRCAGVCRKRGSFEGGVAVVGDAGGGGAVIEGDVGVGGTWPGVNVDADDADTAGAGVDVDTDADDVDADPAGDAGRWALCRCVPPARLTAAAAGVVFSLVIFVENPPLRRWCCPIIAARSSAIKPPQSREKSASSPSVEKMAGAGYFKS